MKKLIFTLLTCCTLFGVQAQYVNQYCGSSSSSVCAPTGQLSKPGLSPLSECQPFFYVDSTYSITIQFQNYDTASLGSTTVTIDSLKIDTIGNLPQGLCWATNKPNNTFGNEENGCINVSGTISDTVTPGQYSLYIVVDAWIHGVGDVTINAAQEGLFYYVRVKSSPADTCSRLVDTVGESATPPTNRFIAYNAGNCSTGGVTCSEALAIHDVISYINTLDIMPNPLNSEAIVKFNSTKTGKVIESITNLVGQEVYSKELQLVLGQNQHTITKGNLSAGIYVYSITDGQSVYSKKLVITE